MTITAPGIDYGFEHETHRISIAGIWARNDQQSEAGRVALTVHNQSARFPDRLVERLLLEHDDAFRFEIGGSVHETGSPVARRVRLYRRSDGQFVGETVSNADGDYRIGNMREGVLHYAIALDDLGVDPNFNALILDQLVGGEPLPPLPTPTRIALYLPPMLVEWGGVEGYRYWRITSLTVPAAHLEFTELRVFADGVDITDDATKTCSDPVFSGALANLFDSNLFSAATWEQAVAQAPGFYFEFDFGGSSVMIDGVKQGAYDNSTRYISGFSLQYFDGVSWVTAGTKSGLAYPGNHTLSELYVIP